MRVIRACRELNIGTAAIYAECDATAIYVKKANEAYLVGPGPVQGFLDAKQIVGLAKRIGADAIHPGYGFLAENAEFAALCQKAGVTFIGPSPQALDLLGDKVKARNLAIKIGVAVVPGTDGPVHNLEEALPCCRKVGYPVMVKGQILPPTTPTLGIDHQNFSFDLFPSLCACCLGQCPQRVIDFCLIGSSGNDFPQNKFGVISNQ